MSDEVNQQTAPVKEQQATPGQNDNQAKSQTYNQIAADHIDTLSIINEQLPKLLAYSAAAISQLTNNPVETSAQKTSQTAQKPANKRYGP
jgi:hypothetical protein